jgi:hypothetical protein
VNIRVVEQYEIVFFEQRDDVIIQQKDAFAPAKQNFKNIMAMYPVGAVGLGNFVGGMAIYIEFLMLKGDF